jgi:hypothetical protein
MDSERNGRFFDEADSRRFRNGVGLFLTSSWPEQEARAVERASHLP